MLPVRTQSFPTRRSSDLGGQEVKTIALRRAAPGLAACSGGNAPPAAEALLHGRLLTLDTHRDTPMHFERAGWNFADRHELATDLSQLDIPRMKDGNLDGGFFAIYTEQGPLITEGYAAALAQDRTSTRLNSSH